MTRTQVKTCLVNISIRIESRTRSSWREHRTRSAPTTSLVKTSREASAKRPLIVSHLDSSRGFGQNRPLMTKNPGSTIPATDFITGGECLPLWLRNKALQKKLEMIDNKRLTQELYSLSNSHIFLYILTDATN